MILAVGACFSLLGSSLLGVGVGVVVLLVCLFVLTTYSGVYFDPERNRYKQATFHFGIETGKWLSMTKYTQLSILKLSGTSSLLSRGNARISSTETIYKLYLLNDTHLQRVLIDTYEGLDDAKAAGVKLSHALKRPMVKFNPKRTTERRR